MAASVTSTSRKPLRIQHVGAEDGDDRRGGSPHAQVLLGLGQGGELGEAAVAARLKSRTADRGTVRRLRFLR